MTRAGAGDPGNPAWTLVSGIIFIVLAVAAFIVPVSNWTHKAPLAGWLLLIAGLCECLLAWARGTDRVAILGLISGAGTLVAGLVLTLDPSATYFSATSLVMIWLFLRGAWTIFMAWQIEGAQIWSWLALSGAVDICLSLVLAVGLEIDTLVFTLFGATAELVVGFAFFLAASLLFNGFAQIGLALGERRDGAQRPS